MKFVSMNRLTLDVDVAEMILAPTTPTFISLNYRNDEFTTSFTTTNFCTSFSKNFETQFWFGSPKALERSLEQLHATTTTKASTSPHFSAFLRRVAFWYEELCRIDASLVH